MLCKMNNPSFRDALSTLTSGEKWWFSFILTLLFGLCSCGPVYRTASKVFQYTGSIPLVEAGGPNIGGVMIMMIVYLCLVRLIIF